MQKISSIRILIADDHPVVREGLVALINRRPDMTVVAEVANGREAVAEFLRHRPDVALVDLRMPEMDGADALAAIRERVPAARVIVLTTYDDDEDIQRSLRAGAKAYMLKDAPREELLACIKAVHEGRTLIPPAIATKLAATIGASPLTPRQVEVLTLVADGKSNKEIAALLFVTEGTVKSHLHAVIGKLDAGDRTQAVTIALKRGLLRL
ncbi:MAG: response regulator transcription factor [Armatimonadetes bacterium]|nr:response regulator transcription factor [Armatimonadota bacterium]